MSWICSSIDPFLLSSGPPVQARVVVGWLADVMARVLQQDAGPGHELDRFHVANCVYLGHDNMSSTDFQSATKSCQLIFQNMVFKGTSLGSGSTLSKLLAGTWMNNLFATLRWHVKLWLIDCYRCIGLMHPFLI